MVTEDEVCRGVDLARFDEIDDESERQRILVAESARFASAFGRLMDARSCAGFSYPRLRVLEILASNGPTIMRDIAQWLGVTPRNMTAVVDALEDAALVTRQPHPADRRATLVELTEEGWSVMHTALRPTVDSMAPLFGSFTQREQHQFLACLIKLRDAMDCNEK